MTEYIKADREVVEVRRGGVNFNVTDQRERPVGQLFRICEVTYTLRTDGYGAWLRKVGDPLHFFEVHTHATRNGQRYGATQRTVECATLEDALKLVEKRFAAARKREVKRFSQYSPVPAMEG